MAAPAVAVKVRLRPADLVFGAVMSGEVAEAAIGALLGALRTKGESVDEIVGAAESNTRVSALMRNIDKSEWLMDPDLEVVEVKNNRFAPTGGRASEFTVFAMQASDTESEEDFE